MDEPLSRSASNIWGCGKDPLDGVHAVTYYEYVVVAAKPRPAPGYWAAASACYHLSSRLTTTTTTSKFSRCRKAKLTAILDNIH